MAHVILLLLLVFEGMLNWDNGINLTKKARGSSSLECADGRRIPGSSGGGYNMVGSSRIRPKMLSNVYVLGEQIFHTRSLFSNFKQLATIIISYAKFSFDPG